MSQVANQTVTIVVVDDEPSITRAINKVLRRERYQIIEFNDPKEALSKVTSLNFQLIISDMRMPQMDGAKLLSEIKLLKPNVRRVLLTGFSDTESSVRAINEGGIHLYLAKPWSNEELKRVVAEQIQAYAKEIRIKAAAGKAKEYAQRADYFKKQMDVKHDTNALIQSEQELKVIANIFNSLLRRLNEPLSLRQEKAIAVGGLLSHKLGMHKLRARMIRYATIFFPINSLVGTSGHARDPFLFETLPLRFSGHLALERVANLLQLSLEAPDQSGPLGMAIEEVPIDAQIIAAAIWVSSYLSEMLPFEDIYNYLEEQRGKRFDHRVVDALKEVLPELPDQIQSNALLIRNLTPGQELAEDVRDGEERLLLARGTVMTEALIAVLNQYEWMSDSVPEIKVVTDDED